MKTLAKKVLSLILTLCMMLTLLPATVLALDNGLVDTSHIIDIFLNGTNTDYDIDGVKDNILDELVGKTKTWSDGSTSTLTADNIRFVTNVTSLDPSNLAEWNVYDHYDPAWYTNAGTTWEATINPSASGLTYADTAVLRPYFGYNDTFGYSSFTTILEQKDAGTLSSLKTVKRLREHIYGYIPDPTVKEASMIFVGYGSPAYTDFLFYPTSNSTNKEVNFKVNSANGNTHSMNGVGFLLNSGIDSSGYIHGYVLYYTLSGDSNSITGCSNVTLYEINDNVSASAFHDNGFFTSYCTSVSGASVNNPTWSTTTTSIKLSITSTGVTVYHDAAGGTNYTEVGSFTMVDDGANYGFGPLVHYGGHGCSATSYFTFDNLAMSFVQSSDSVLDPIYYSNYMQGTERYFINLLDAGQGEVTTADEAALTVMNNQNIRYITDQTNPFLGSGNALDRNGLTVTASGSTTADKLNSVVSQSATYILGNNAWISSSYTPTVPVAAMSLVTNSIDHTAAPTSATETQVDIINRHYEVSSKIYAKDLAADVSGDSAILTRSYTITFPNGTSQNISAGGAGGYTELFTVATDSAKGIYTVTQTVTYTGGTSTSINNFFELRVDDTAPTPSAVINTENYSAAITFTNTASSAANTYTSDLASYYYVVNQSSAQPTAGTYTAVTATTLSNVKLGNLAAGDNYLHMFLKDEAGNIGYARQSFEVTGYVVTYEEGATDRTDIKLPGITLTLKATTNAAAPTSESSFVGWSTDSNATEAQYLPGGEYTQDVAITLYPVWKVVPQYTVIFNYNYPSGTDGQPANGSQTGVPQGTLATAPSTPSTPIAATNGDQYDFDGWYTAASGGEKWVFAGNVVMTNITLYAHWTKRLNVTFDTNLDATVAATSSAPIAPGTQHIVYGGKATAPVALNTWVSTDGDTYVFDGWYTAASIGEKWSFAGYVVSADTMLYAHWIQKYNVAFSMNYPADTTAGTTTDPTGQVIDPGKKVTEPVLDSTNKTITAGGYEYTFTGWYTEASGGDKWSFSVDTVNASMTLYAQWSQKHNVSFNLNYPDVAGKPTDTTAPATQQVAHGGYVDSTKVTTPSTWTATNGDTYYFAGWYTDAAAGDLWYFSGRTVDGNMTLYARWSLDQFFTITFDDNLNDPNDDYATVPASKQLLATAALVNVADACRVDYIFDGWYKDATCRNAYDYSQTLGSNYTAGISGSGVTLYAKWIAKYDDSTDVSIDTDEMSDGAYRAYYSDYIYARDATVASDMRVYRSFVVTSGVLPNGLYLNSRTGEIYGVPMEIGDFSFTVRMKNDEGTWISNAKTISLTVDKAVFSVDMKDDDAGLSKTYGQIDPNFYPGTGSLELTFTKGAPSSIDYRTNNYGVTFYYDYSANNSTRENNALTFDPTQADTLMYAPDLAAPSITPMPSFTLNMDFQREDGEDAGEYKLYMTDSCIWVMEDQSKIQPAGYDFTITEALGAEALTCDENGTLTTAPQYVFTIYKLAGVNYTATAEYGNYKTGGDAASASWSVVSSATSLVNSSGIGVVDTVNSVPVATTEVGTGGYVKVGSYSNAGTPASLGPVTLKNTAASIGTSSTNTTENYDMPVFTLTITTRELTPVGKTMSVTQGSSLTLDKLQGFINLTGLVSGDMVGITITSVKIGDNTYTDFADSTFTDALADLTGKTESKAITIGYSTTLTGSDAANYTIASSGTVDATLNVYSGGGGGALTAPGNVPVIVDGISYSIGTQKVSENITTVTVDEDKLSELIENAEESVIIPVDADTDIASAQLILKDVKDMTDRNLELTVRTGDVDYTFPARAIDTASVLSELGATDPAQVSVTVTITQMGSKPAVEGAIVVLPAVGFTVTATYNGKTIEVEIFDRYVSRTIETTAEQAASITTAVVIEADGTARHVPTSVFQKDGKYYATAHSLTNSTYVFIYNEQRFADATDKWYEDIVNEMASRKIIYGYDSDTFGGDRSITRAEFAAIIVRALGLPEDGTSSFTDVDESAWYFGAVGKAFEYGIVNGRTTTVFDPNANITRQEAMAMVHRAAAITELTGSLSNLSAFSDANSISAWALDDANWNVGTGLIQGNSEGLICGGDNITRGETATIILRLLQKSELLDVRARA